MYGMVEDLPILRRRSGHGCVAPKHGDVPITKPSTLPQIDPVHRFANRLSFREYRVVTLRMSSSVIFFAS